MTASTQPTRPNSPCRPTTPSMTMNKSNNCSIQSTTIMHVLATLPRPRQHLSHSVPIPPITILPPLISTNHLAIHRPLRLDTRVSCPGCIVANSKRQTHMQRSSTRLGSRAIGLRRALVRLTICPGQNCLESTQSTTRTIHVSPLAPQRLSAP